MSTTVRQPDHQYHQVEFISAGREKAPGELIKLFIQMYLLTDWRQNASPAARRILSRRTGAVGICDETEFDIIVADCKHQITRRCIEGGSTVAFENWLADFTTKAPKKMKEAQQLKRIDPTTLKVASIPHKIMDKENTNHPNIMMKYNIGLLANEASTLYYNLRGSGKEIIQEANNVLRTLSDIDLGKTDVEDFQEIVKSLMEIINKADSVTHLTEGSKKVLDGLEKLREELKNPAPTQDCNNAN